MHVVVICHQGLEMVFRVGFAILQVTLDDLLARDMEGMIKVELIHGSLGLQFFRVMHLSLGIVDE